MKREVEYHKVTVEFIVTHREARRATFVLGNRSVQSRLAQMLASAICGNATNRLDAEEITRAR